MGCAIRRRSLRSSCTPDLLGRPRNRIGRFKYHGRGAGEETIKQGGKSDDVVQGLRAQLTDPNLSKKTREKLAYNLLVQR